MRTNRLETRARAIMAQHGAEVDRIKQDLLNCDIPAQRSINAGFARMGVDRLTPGGDDLWEMITCLEAGWEYERPEPRLVARWAAY